jgi:tetratricopeptide (TPR) repeat protein
MGGHRQEAIDELTKGIELAPKSSDGHNIYGVILARMGKLDEAIAELQKAVDLAPQSAECRFNLGRAWRQATGLPTRCRSLKRRPVSPAARSRRSCRCSQPCTRRQDSIRRR